MIYFDLSILLSYSDLFERGLTHVLQVNHDALQSHRGFQVLQLGQVCWNSLPLENDEVSRFHFECQPSPIRIVEDVICILTWVDEQGPEMNSTRRARDTLGGTLRLKASHSPNAKRTPNPKRTMLQQQYSFLQKY